MRMRRFICLALIGMLLASMLPMGALAARKSAVSIKLPGKVGFMRVGTSATLRAKLTGISGGDLTLASSDESVATISPLGEIRALSVGRAVITLSAGGVAAKCGIVVLPASVSVKVGDSVQLPYGTVERYAVKDKAIAAISKKGLITGRKAGNTMIGIQYGKQRMTIGVVVTGDGTEPAMDIGGGDAGAADTRIVGLDAAAQASQIVLVEYTGGSNATLSVHEKKNGQWRQLMETPAYVGRNGIGKTVEGDKKTPLGTYNLTTPFGILDDPGAAQPYTKVTKYHYWCGSSSSKYYNQMVDSRVTGRSVTSSDEHLIKYGKAYNYCMFIDYNSAGVAHKGSCIFLHCFGSNKYTAGCVAISQSAMKKIVQWAKPGAKIVILNA